MLVEWAGQFDPALLRKLGTRILDHVAPDLADAAAAAALAAEAAGPPATGTSPSPSRPAGGYGSAAPSTRRLRHCCVPSSTR